MLGVLICVVSFLALLCHIMEPAILAAVASTKIEDKFL